MIKNTVFSFIAFIAIAFSGDGPYKNGNYSGTSQSIYTNEPYYGHSVITVENGIITKIAFVVRDSSRHVNFDDKYEKYFAGNDEYIQQCRNDWKGILSYPDSLLKLQHLEKIDVISGATWSFNLFKAATLEALSSAENK